VARALTETYLVFSQPARRIAPSSARPRTTSDRKPTFGRQVVIQEHDSDNGSYEEKGDAPDEVGECGFCDAPAIRGCTTGFRQVVVREELGWLLLPEDGGKRLQRR